MYYMEVFAGVDVGGSHVAVGFVDSTGHMLTKTEVPIDRLALTPEDLVEIIKSLIQTALDKMWILCSIGIGCPGQSKNGVIVAASNLPLFKNFPLCGSLQQHFPSIPILLLNDADAAICAEVWGKEHKDRYKEYANIAMITLGTGVGCGLILNQQLHQGSNGLTEAGHMIVSIAPDGVKCLCGQTGCVEVYSSARSTARRLRECDEAAGVGHNGSTGKTGQDDVDDATGGREVLLRYSKGDAAAMKVVEETAEHLAVLCINLCRVVDPDVIIFTGGLAKAGETLIDLVQKHINSKTWTILQTTVKLVTAQSIESGGVVGAAMAAKKLLVKQQALEEAAKLASSKALPPGGHLLEDSIQEFSNAAINEQQKHVVWSDVEKSFLERSGHEGYYSCEHIPTIEVTNIYELGKIVSQRFIEWVKLNPTGVVALPTGKTPEFFIKTLEKYKTQWNSSEVQAELQASGLAGTAFPDMRGLKFVMLDEFFPMHSTHRNSFCRYIRTYYLDLLGILPENVLTFDLVAERVVTTAEMDLFDSPQVDLSLLDRTPQGAKETQQQKVLRKVRQYCEDYDTRVAAMGGIGFFLGGIGPDGHIAFNQQGQPLDSPTRLVNFNYPSAAQAAGDLGGIENSRGKAAITIGLKTITANADATIIIMAAGEGKSKIVRSALEDSASPERPASAFHGHRGARFYISHGAATHLTARKALRMANASTERAVQWALQHSAGLTCPGGAQPSLSVQPPQDYLLMEAYLYEQSVRLNVPVHDLTPETLASSTTNIGCPKALQDPLACCALVACAARRLREKIEAGLKASEIKHKSIIHTGPHHDDVLLSYHGAMHDMLGRVGDPYADVAVSNAAYNCYTGGIAPSTSSNITTNSTTSSSIYPAPSTVAMDVQITSGTGAISAASRPPKRARSISESSMAGNLNGNMDLTHPLGEMSGGNVNHFAYLTSGFHSVNESYLQAQCEAVMAPASATPIEATAVLGISKNTLRPAAGMPSSSTSSRQGSGDNLQSEHSGGSGQETTFLESVVRAGEVTRDYDEIMCCFFNAFYSRNFPAQDYLEHVIFLRKCAEVWNIALTLPYHALITALVEKVQWLLQEYLPNHNPGDSIPKDIQMLKGCMRETEVDRVWACSKMPMNRVHHLRSKFYTDDFFTPMPSVEEDAMPMANLLKQRQPHVLTVAFDPEGTGPDTHYKVLLVVAAGLRLVRSRGELIDSNPLVWGYRNVWFEFTPSDATLMIPVSGSDLELMHDTFMSCFTTQKAASFPSPYHDGPFSSWACSIQQQQGTLLRTLLGAEYFRTHVNDRVRDSSGFVFIKAMYAEQFLQEVEQLKTQIENQS